MPKSDMQGTEFDFPVCNESLNQLGTVLNVKYSTSGDSGPMNIARFVRKVIRLFYVRL